MIESGDLDIEVLAERMLRDYDARTPGRLFADGLRLTVEDARRLQDAVASLRQQRGEQIAGYKIGCVCAGNQKANGLSRPVWGRLWSTEQHADGATLSRTDFANVAIEGEFAVTLRRSIAPGDVSLTSIVDSVELVFPVIELHNLVFHGVDPKGPELIANNAIHSGVVRGRGCPKPAANVVTDLSIEFDGERIDEWADIRWPEDILQAVGWLVDSLEQAGVGLQRGQAILTGALGPPLSVSDVSSVRIASSHFGTVTAWFR